MLTSVLISVLYFFNIYQHFYQHFYQHMNKRKNSFDYLDQSNQFNQFNKLKRIKLNDINSFCGVGVGAGAGAGMSMGMDMGMDMCESFNELSCESLYEPLDEIFKCNIVSIFNKSGSYTPPPTYKDIIINGSIDQIISLTSDTLYDDKYYLVVVCNQYGGSCIMYQLSLRDIIIICKETNINIIGSIYHYINNQFNVTQAVTNIKNNMYY